jgi:hypothetical protein
MQMPDVGSWPDLPFDTLLGKGRKVPKPVIGAAILRHMNAWQVSAMEKLAAGGCN